MHTNTQLDQLANASTEDGIKSDENGTTITVRKERTYFCRSEDEKYKPCKAKAAFSL